MNEIETLWEAVRVLEAQINSINIELDVFGRRLKSDELLLEYLRHGESDVSSADRPGKFDN